MATLPADDGDIRDLYERLLDAWNRHSAADFAALFSVDANVVGFDGSLMNGQAEIESSLSKIFTDHVTATYVGKVREVRLLTSDVGVLRAVAGMIPPGQNDLNPAVNTIQTLVAIQQGRTWRIAMYQNTPAAFHGRPEEVQALTDELRQLITR